MTLMRIMTENVIFIHALESCYELCILLMEGFEKIQPKINLAMNNKGKVFKDSFTGAIINKKFDKAFR